MQLFFDYSFLKGSTCFGRFLSPLSGANNCTFSFRYCQPILLQAGIVDEMKFHLIHDTSLQQYWLTMKLNVQLCAPDDGRRNRPKRVEPFRIE